MSALEKTPSPLTADVLYGLPLPALCNSDNEKLTIYKQETFENVIYVLFS